MLRLMRHAAAGPLAAQQAARNAHPLTSKRPYNSNHVPQQHSRSMSLMLQPSGSCYSREAHAAAEGLTLQPRGWHCGTAWGLMLQPRAASRYPQEAYTTAERLTLPAMCLQSTLLCLPPSGQEGRPLPQPSTPLTFTNGCTCCAVLCCAVQLHRLIPQPALLLLHLQL